MSSPGGQTYWHQAYKGPRLSLSDFMDYALLTVDLVFTVGVVKERDTTLTHVIAVALEYEHKMAATTTPCQVMADLHEPSQVTVDRRDQVKSQLIVVSQVKSQLIAVSQVKSQLIVVTKSSHN